MQTPTVQTALKSATLLAVTGIYAAVYLQLRPASRASTPSVVMVARDIEERAPHYYELRRAFAKTLFRQPGQEASLSSPLRKPTPSPPPMSRSRAPAPPSSVEMVDHSRLLYISYVRADDLRPSAWLRLDGRARHVGVGDRFEDYVLVDASPDSAYVEYRATGERLAVARN